MMRHWLSVTLALAASAVLLLAAPATAQLAPGHSGQSSAPTQAYPDDYWFLLRAMGDCAARTKAKDAAAFLATTPASVEEGRAFRKLFGGQRNMCMQNFVSATLIRAHVRGAVAESMYERLAAEATAGVTVAEASSANGNVVTLHDFARCYIREHANSAQSLLKNTRLATDEERTAIVRMAADFAPCLPANRDVQIDPVEIRMALAEAMYHMTASRQQS